MKSFLSRYSMYTSRIDRFFFLTLFSLVLTQWLQGCAASQTAVSRLQNIEVPSPIPVYKIDIAQGNFVSSEQVAALRTGMPKATVKNILGTPLLTDVFHADRWDYVFSMTQNGKLQPVKRLTVYFKNEVLERHEGDAMPSEVEFVKSLQIDRKFDKVPPLVASDKELEAFTLRENARIKAAANNAAPAATSAPAKTYPPLESN